jgi:pimeloyl-ACP methyl ester carboxylesterase
VNNATATLQHVTSKDGTTIAYDRIGSGPPVVLVCGGSVDRMSNAGLAAILASDFTVFNFDRRGRGDSGDTPPYAIEREVEDIDAVVEAAGGSACLYGTSSGAALALEATARLGSRIRKLALWEPPYILDPAARPPVASEQLKVYDELLGAGRRGDAAEYFMAKVVRMPADFVAFARSQPWWPAQEAIAHTLPYDATIMGDYSLPTKQAAKVTAPTIVLAGGADFPFMPETAEALAKAIPAGRYRRLEGQGHNVDAAVLAPAVAEFFGG